MVGRLCWKPDLLVRVAVTVVRWLYQLGSRVVQGRPVALLSSVPVLPLALAAAAVTWFCAGVAVWPPLSTEVQRPRMVLWFWRLHRGLGVSRRHWRVLTSQSPALTGLPPCRPPRLYWGKPMTLARVR